MREIRHLTACPMCDTLHQRPHLGPGQIAHCRACHMALQKFSRLDRARITPLVLTCLMLFIIANVFPIVSLEMQGTQVPLTLGGAVLTLLDTRMIAVALMVFLPTLLLPGLYLSMLLGLLCLDRISAVPDRTFNQMVRMMQQLSPWSMVEVFLLGVLVALVKLSSMATVIPGPALWALMGTTITLTLVLTFRLPQLMRRRSPAGRLPVARGWLRAALLRSGRDEADERALVERLRAAHGSVRALGCIACHHCDTLWAQAREGLPCGHCGAPLLSRKRGGLSVTWALLLTAVILYFPANFLPIMTTSTVFGDAQDTILSGVVYFWAEGEWVLAAIIFIASFLIPLFKLVALVLLAILTQRGSLWRLGERTRLYEIVEWVGRWSMLDVFVVAVTASLVQLPGFARVVAGPGIAAFGAVVVLTMLATMSFDPRLAWDARFRQEAGSRPA